MFPECLHHFGKIPPGGGKTAKKASPHFHPVLPLMVGMQRGSGWRALGHLCVQIKGVPEPSVTGGADRQGGYRGASRQTPARWGRGFLKK